MKRSRPSSSRKSDGGNGGNKSDEKNAALKQAPKRAIRVTTTAACCFETAILADDEAVVFNHMLRFLHWKDAVAVSGVNKASHNMYMNHCHVILKPLLKCLNSLVQSNQHEYCGKIYAPRSLRTCTCDNTSNIDAYHRPRNQPLAGLDPRYQDTYDTWSNHKKCAAMVEFIGMVTANLRPHLQMDLNDASDPRKTPHVIGTIQGSWSFGIGVPANALFFLYPRRTVLAFNLVLICTALGTLESGDNYNFEDAVLGRGHISPGGSSFGIGVVEILSDMVPFDDKSLIRFLRGLLPCHETRHILGEGLTRRLCLTAPLMDWVGKDANNNNNEVVLLPRMERFHLATAQEAMEDWAPHDDGRDCNLQSAWHAV